MNEDNIKTWPEKMWFSLMGYGKKIPKFHEVEADDLLFCDLPRYEKNIEYIRADVAKEREAKLIKSASAFRTDAFDPTNPDSIECIYWDARLEELE